MADEQNVMKLILWSLGTVAAMVGGFVVRDRQVAKSIADGDSELHARINKVRDEYVRRDDLASRFEGVEKVLGEMKDEQRRTSDRIDKVLSRIAAAQIHND